MIGELDRQDNNKLTTPNGATSYKGKLERFLISDIEYDYKVNFENTIANMSWETYKQDMMYMVRFQMYQFFSDNFSEINYYIANEKRNSQAHAIAEGIIKETRSKVPWYLISYGSYHRKYIDVKAGDKITIEIDYSGDRYTPSLYASGWELGSIAYSWWWNFRNSCATDLFNPKDPLYQEGLFRLAYPSTNSEIRIIMKKNNQTIFDEKPQQFSFWSFTLRKRSIDGPK